MRVQTVAASRTGTVGSATSPVGRRAARPGRGWTWAAAIALVAPAAAFLALRLGTPSDGAHLRPGSSAVTSEGVMVSPLVPSPLREGDVVTEIGGVPLASLAASTLGIGAEGAGAPAHAPAAAPDGASTGTSGATLRASWEVGEQIVYTVDRGGAVRHLVVTLGAYPLAATAARTWGTIVFAIVTLLVATFVFLRRPDLAPARVLFVGAAALVGSTTWSLGLQVADFVEPTGFWLYQATTVGVFMIYWTTILHFALVFPRPLWLARTRWGMPIAYAAPFAALGTYLAVTLPRIEGPLAKIAAVAPVTAPHAALFLGLAMVVMAFQYRRHRSGPAQKQIRWVVLAASTTGGAGLALYILPPVFGFAAVHPNAIGAIVTVFPLAIAVAVLRYNLFDIDTLLNRALVYGSLTFTIGAAYVGVVAGLGTVFRASEDLLPALVATVVAAAAFQPLRDRLQRLVNRMMYGDRDEPAAVLGRLGERLEGTLAPDAVLPTLVETVAHALKVPHVSIVLGAGSGSRVAAEFGRPVHDPVAYPLTYRGAAIGRLSIAPRAVDEPFTPSEETLIGTIARQASVAAYAVQTTADLRRSRERLVAAREEERRRLRRDLHDGLGPALAGLALKLDAASNVLDRDTRAAKALLEQLRDEVQGAVMDLRRLVHALRPPALDDLGLVAALDEHVRRSAHPGLSVSFDAPEILRPVPAGVELAIYRIVQEALANVVRHAEASSCSVSLTASEAILEIVVADDGSGIAPGAEPGVGLESMRERAVELGGSFDVWTGRTGGTRITARLPLGEDA